MTPQQQAVAYARESLVIAKEARAGQGEVSE